MKKIVILGGDGIGPEVCEQAEKALKTVARKFGIEISIEYGLLGGIAYDETGTPFPDETLKICRNADAILLGAVGGPKWESLEFSLRPERGLLGIRSALNLYANLRPARIYGDLASASSLKEEIVRGVDVMVVRELIAGIYFGTPRGIIKENGLRVGINTLRYDEEQIRRIAKTAFKIAGLRGKKLCSIDKANVLEATELWREVVTEENKNFPEIELNHMYVDNSVMQLVKNPKQFDTIVTTNMFGDIVSDAAAMLTGSIGMLPSASLGDCTGLYEPVHGSAPDIAGQDKANPLATILSVGLIFQYAFKKPEVNSRIEKTVSEILSTHRTFDIASPNARTVGCKEMGDLICEKLETI